MGQIFPQTIIVNSPCCLAGTFKFANFMTLISNKAPDEENKHLRKSAFFEWVYKYDILHEMAVHSIKKNPCLVSVKSY